MKPKTLTLIVMLLIFSSWLAIDISQGWSLIVLPVIVSGIILSSKLGVRIFALAIVVACLHVAFGLIGLWILPLLVIATCLLAYAISRSTVACVAVAIISVVLWTAKLPTLGRPTQEARVSNNMANMSKIFHAIEQYRDQTGHYPDRLLQLDKTDIDIRDFRAAGCWETAELWWKGPIRLYWHCIVPGLARTVNSWSDVDGADYLYRKPPTQETLPSIVLWTRPGLLSGNRLIAVDANGSRKLLEPGEWTNDSRIAKYGVNQ